MDENERKEVRAEMTMKSILGLVCIQAGSLRGRTCGMNTKRQDD